MSVGNCVILKPSEVSEHTAKFLEEFIPQYLDKVKEWFEILASFV